MKKWEQATLYLVRFLTIPFFVYHGGAIATHRFFRGLERLVSAAMYLVRQNRIRRSARSDPRRFYLILHSFTETTLIDSTLVKEGQDECFVRYYYTSMLEILEESIGPANPVVTVGSPFPSGKYAFRVEVNNNSWQHVCRFLLPRCKAIIFIPEVSPSLMTELKWIIESELWKKTIVVVPCFVQHYIDRWNRIRAEFEARELNLPPYEKQGMLYLANSDLSVRITHCLYDHGEEMDGSIDSIYLQRRIQYALDDITGRMGVYGVPLKDVVEEIASLEERLTYHRVLSRQIDRTETNEFPGRRVFRR
jgi:hypothetical protein